MVSISSSVNLETAPAYWFLNSLHLLLALNETEEGAYSLLHLTAPPQFETPYHLHHDEDEAFYILDGEVTVIRDGEEIVAGPGSYIFLPRGVPHGFKSSSDKDSHVLIHAIPGGKVGFVAMMLAMATPIQDRHKLPEPTPSDFKRLAELCEQNKISILGPLPS
ncbi:cupin domain-containing protein [Terriglobus roseus]|uniref:Cupin domain protein n=1 Tax=Terriglobus roseus TaxID=392734 RepID=A0A1G7KLB4_9BACT|nr:cupin domain-containing protein [Terriglobus roseus]SDF37977.1 Cupin domain protein [Terriglobus roseus]